MFFDPRFTATNRQPNQGMPPAFLASLQQLLGRYDVPPQRQSQPAGAPSFNQPLGGQPQSAAPMGMMGNLRGGPRAPLSYAQMQQRAQMMAGAQQAVNPYNSGQYNQPRPQGGGFGGFGGGYGMPQQQMGGFNQMPQQQQGFGASQAAAQAAWLQSMGIPQSEGGIDADMGVANQASAERNMAARAAQANQPPASVQDLASLLRGGSQSAAPQPLTQQAQMPMGGMPRMAQPLGGVPQMAGSLEQRFLGRSALPSYMADDFISRKPRVAGPAPGSIGFLNALRSMSSQG